MRSKNIIVVLLVFFSVFLDAQTYFKPGYVIKSEGDTLFGEVDYRGDTRMSKTCTFRYNAKDSTHHFSPEDIKGYRFPESKYYISKTVNGRKVFLEFLINGRVNLYYLRDDKGNNHYYMEKETPGLTEIPYEENIRQKDGREYLYTSTRHIGFLMYYLQDAEGLKPEIMKLKKLGHNNLITLAKDYHTAVCKGDKCIIYEKKLPPLKIDVEITGGLMSLNDGVSGKLNIPQAGVIAHIWMPLVNENLFIKTGILYSPVKNEDQLGTGLEIPFQVEYIYPHGIIRPKVAIGTKFPFLPLDLTPGANIRLAKRLYWTVNFNVSFISTIPSDFNALAGIKMFSESVSTGLYLKL